MAELIIKANAYFKWRHRAKRELKIKSLLINMESDSDRSESCDQSQDEEYDEE